MQKLFPYLKDNESVTIVDLGSRWLKDNSLTGGWASDEEFDQC